MQSTTVEFNYVPAGKHESKLSLVRLAMSKWSRTLLYVFVFKFINRARTPVLEINCENTPRGAAKFHHLLQSLSWPKADESEIKFDLTAENHIVIPQSVKDATFICEVEMNHWKGSVTPRIKSVTPLETVTEGKETSDELVLPDSL